MPEKVPLIRARGLKKSFVAGEASLPVLLGVDLDIQEGGITLVTGPSGSGKSTLLNLVGGLERPDAGQLEVAGYDMTQLRTDRLIQFRRHVVGFVFQFYNLLPTLTALENVMIGLEPLGIVGEKAIRQASPLLEQVGLGAAMDKFPGQLSGGEQQRVALARALARRPRLVLADEPTGSLDRLTTTRVMTLISEINRTHGTSFFIVTHNQQLRIHADRILTIEDGKVVRVESGRTQEGG